MAGYLDLFAALDEANVRYVVVGGMAVVLHGYGRLTMDADLVVDLAEAEARKAIEAITGIGLVPRVPVDARSFADPAQRSRWIREKNMQVFSLVDRDDPRRVVNLFVEVPVPFEELYGRSVVVEVEDVQVRIASIPDVITMKEAAGRDKDRDDIAALHRLQDGPGTVSDWPVTYEANSAAQFHDIAELTPGQRMRWLEEAAALALSRRPAGGQG